MNILTNKDLIERAKNIVIPKKIKHGFTVSDCGCALVTDKGNVYLGVSIDTCSSMGFCSEHSAVASMVTNGEYRIKKIVAVLEDGTILSPCGRCREFIYQIDDTNLDTEVILDINRTVKLRDLLPFPWDENLK
jgi:cytidine deaminase